MAIDESDSYHAEPEDSAEYPDDRAYERLDEVIDEMGITRREAATRAGIHETQISRGVNEHRGLDRHWKKIARGLGLSLDWLLLGIGPKLLSDKQELLSDEPKTAVREDGVPYEAGRFDDEDRPRYDASQPRELALVGTVSAGSGMVPVYDEPRRFRLRESLAVMRVTGNSAYPIAFDGQFVLVDTRREVHHNNLVIVQTSDGNSYLKRYCEAKSAPDGYVLASINAGVDSPYIPRGDILAMLPVVGIIFEEQPREETPA